MSWYRFTDGNFNYIPTSSTPEYACGSYWVAWMSGTYPAPYESGSATLCLNNGMGTCGYSTSLNIESCGSFFVFQFSFPMVCNARICTTDAAPY